MTTITYSPSEWTPATPWVVEDSVAGHIASFAKGSDAVEYVFSILRIADFRIVVIK